MKCPSCEEGTIIQSHIKTTKGVMYICEFCGCYWVKGETIKADTGYPKSSLFGHDREYSVGNTEFDELSRSILYPKFK